MSPHRSTPTCKSSSAPVIQTGDLVVNATPLGMNDGDLIPAVLELFGLLTATPDELRDSAQLRPQPW
jgi:shikimate 5-dehydrogenase